MPLDLTAVTSMVGGGADLLVARALRACGEAPSRTRIEHVLADFLDRYQAAPCVATRIYPGAQALLEALRERGIALGICTNKPAELTGLVLAGLGMAPLFSSVVAASPALPPKPAPDMLARVLAELAVTPHEALMVGDSAVDAATAAAAGVRSVLLSHGYGALEASHGEMVADFAALGRMIGM